MKHLKQTFSLAIMVLVAGLVFAIGSALLDRQAGISSENFADLSTNLSCKLFTLAAIAFLVVGLEFQRRKTARHIQELERKVESLSHPSLVVASSPIEPLRVLPRTATA